MALSSRLSPLLLWLLISVPGLKFGINYGQIANDLPSPARVATMLQSLNVNKVKLYDADPKVLSAFANTGVEFIIAISNDNVANMTDASRARSWLAQRVQPFLPQTRITCITVGNEVLSGTDTALMSNLVPAMQAMYQALVALGLSEQVNVSTAHSLAILSTSYPPSAGAFSPDLAQYVQPLLNFLAQIKSPFLVNAYPFFAYKADPSAISLPYVLFQPNAGVTDPTTNLTYDNMLYAQLDAVYAAMRSMGHADDVDVRISETGWPSKGDADEPGATVANAAAYNGNLLKRIAEGQGTPMRPAVPIDVYVFALFNEDLKPGPTSERNYGLFYPDGTPVYNIGLLAGSAFSPSPSSLFSSSSAPNTNTNRKLLLEYIYAQKLLKRTRIG
ncbi:Glucan endo-1,3-beta-glucosidase 14 [Ananas comosus]|uniref:glucan endo-1,3-beta-D-glucosidase n=1 Tax=Ananas comosus TaxID=4615 RepID=A0A199W7N6_ANACO|nr:Glucan endo-1,3-beta-glucosidase 14 [Ananas comosus]